MGTKYLHRDSPMHGPASPCLTHLHCFPWPSVWEGNRLRGKMERQIRAEVKRENRKAGRKKSFQKVQLQSDDRLVEGNEQRGGLCSPPPLPALLCDQTEAKRAVLLGTLASAALCNKGERLK